MDGDTLLMLIVVPIVILVVLVLAVGATLVVRDTIRGRGRWGVNMRAVQCPRCGEPAPVFRKPANRQQALWGGHTCAECGQEYDKWGQPVEDDGSARSE